VRGVLVAGSYPPVPGRAATLSLAAVESAMARDDEVVAVSPRASAAHLHLPISGLQAARNLWRLRRSTGADSFVLCVEPGVPLTSQAGVLRRAVESALLRGVMRRFSRTTILSGTEPRAISSELRALSRAADEIVVVSAQERDLVAAMLATHRPQIVVEKLLRRASGEVVDGGVDPFGPPETEAKGLVGHAAARAERVAYRAEHAAARAAHVLLGDNAHKLGRPLRRAVEPIRSRVMRRARGNAR